MDRKRIGIIGGLSVATIALVSGGIYLAGQSKKTKEEEMFSLNVPQKIEAKIETPKPVEKPAIPTPPAVPIATPAPTPPVQVSPPVKPLQPVVAPKTRPIIKKTVNRKSEEQVHIVPTPQASVATQPKAKAWYE